MADDFENHCWKDIVPPDVLDIYTHYARKTFVGPSPALLAIDLYELAYQGGPSRSRSCTRPIPAPAARTPMPRSSRPSGCSPRRAQPASRSSTPPRTRGRTACRRASPRPSASACRTDPALYAIKSEFKPQPGDVVITKQRASGFYGTPLMAHLTQLGIQTVIVCGESTSGCVRASSVDAYSNGFHVVVVEECCFDRSLLSHKVNLFDLHHKYTDVMHVDEVVAHLNGLAVKKAS